MKVSWKFYLDKMKRSIWRKLGFISTVFQNNHVSYRICNGRNMPPFFCYGKTSANFVRNYLSKTGPWSISCYLTPCNSLLLDVLVFCAFTVIICRYFDFDGKKVNF